jgi:predicted nucleic acid-binding Zn ribbon protein
MFDDFFPEKEWTICCIVCGKSTKVHLPFKGEWVCSLECEKNYKKSTAGVPWVSEPIIKHCVVCNKQYETIYDELLNICSSKCGKEYLKRIIK